jgi:pimeloyl-ACP methyl ester carboxylesterase
MKRVLKKLTIGSLLLAVVFFFSACLFLQFKSDSYQKNNASDVALTAGKFIDIDGESIFTQETGPPNGPAIIFIHGTGSWSELWKPTMKLLSSHGYHCIALDLPPFGFTYSQHKKIMYDRVSQAKRILGVIDALKIEKATFVGHSFGGRATLTAAFMEPARVDRLILIDAALGFIDEQGSNPSPAPYWIKFLFHNKFLNKTISSIGTYPKFTKKFVQLFVSNPNSVTPEVEKIYQQPLRVKDKTRMMGDWLTDFLLSTDYELINNMNPYQKFPAPVFLIWGASDTITPLWQAKKISKMFNNAQILEMVGIGHIPMIEDQEMFHEQLLTVFD